MSYSAKDARKIRRGFVAGRTAQEAYDLCCAMFGFHFGLRDNFRQHQMLYAKYATPERYSVWMLAHNNFIESIDRSKRWYNIFSKDEIKEVWLVPDDVNNSQSDDSLRVTFAKVGAEGYVFQGIYRPVKLVWEMVEGKLELVRTFKRVEDAYPVKVKGEELERVEDSSIIEAVILENGKATTVTVDVTLRPAQKGLLGKKVGDTFELSGVKLTYQIKKIFKRL